MRRSSFADMSCSIAQSLEVLGEWWTLLIIRDAFLGITRFEDFQQRLGIARNVLAARLDTLVDAGVLERRVYDEGRGRADYVLTAMGRALWPVMTALRQWGDKHIVGKGHEPVLARHETCGSKMTAHLACDQCGEKLDPRDVRLLAGPGLDRTSPLPPALQN
ncbi:MAG TPA: helix-turn-helix domain-containing protein [Acidimicrobiales bacterium]|nr:helix-turn-helix domain-containing protein [Acidimicrobiales bacterium]